MSLSSARSIELMGELLFSYFANPEFGVEFAIEDAAPTQPTTRLENRVDDIEILQSREHTDAYAVTALSSHLETWHRTLVLPLCLDVSDGRGQTRS